LFGEGALRYVIESNLENQVRELFSFIKPLFPTLEKLFFGFVVIMPLLSLIIVLIERARENEL
jgi:hypothetical protein